MTLRSYRAFQALILAAIGVFLLEKIWSGTLFWYINQRYLILIFATGIGFLALAQTILASRQKKHEHADHDHHHEQTYSRWGLLIIALPVILGVVIPQRPLGTAAIANKGMNTNAPLTVNGSATSLELASMDRTALDWIRAYNYESDVTKFDGQKANVIGFVYHDSRLAKDEFLVGRFALSCCVADATAIGMIVKSEKSASFADNSWVRVAGTVSAAQIDGKNIPSITAEEIDQVSEPEQPYLYP